MILFIPSEKAKWHLCLVLFPARIFSYFFIINLMNDLNFYETLATEINNYPKFIE